MNECVYLLTYTMTIIRVWKDNLHVIKCYTISFTLKRNGHRQSGISLQRASKSNKVEKPTIGEPDQRGQFGTFGFPDPLDDLSCQKWLATELENFSSLWVNASFQYNLTSRAARMHVPSSSPQWVAEAAMSLPQSTSLVVSLCAAWRSRLQLQQIDTTKEL